MAVNPSPPKCGHCGADVQIGLIPWLVSTVAGNHYLMLCPNCGAIQGIIAAPR